MKLSAKQGHLLVQLATKRPVRAHANTWRSLERARFVEHTSLGWRLTPEGRRIAAVWTLIGQPSAFAQRVLETLRTSRSPLRTSGLVAALQREDDPVDQGAVEDVIYGLVEQGRIRIEPDSYLTWLPPDRQVRRSTRTRTAQVQTRRILRR